MSDRSTRLAGLYAATAAIAAVVLSPLLALSYFSIGEGADELENGTVRAWADPARDVVGGLLTWASPERENAQPRLFISRQAGFLACGASVSPAKRTGRVTIVW